MDKVAVTANKTTKEASSIATIQVALAGPRGRMGSEALQMIEANNNLTLVGCIDHKNAAQADVPIFTDVRTCLEKTNPDVLIDLTVPEVGYTHTRTALELGVRPVVGTTGFTEAQVKELTSLAEEKQIGCIIAPNFALGAILMMKFSQMAAQYFPDVEILEKHHDQKVDAPSGTAIKTSELIEGARTSSQRKKVEEYESLKGARGGNKNGIHIHSMRLPGLVAHQEVTFGGEGETLTIKHDSMARSSFMEGIKLCIEEVMDLQTCVYGLENIIQFKQ